MTKIKIQPKHYPDNLADRQPWQIVANEVVMARYYKNKWLTVEDLAKKLKWPKEEVEEAVKALWADLTTHKGYVVLKSWVWPEFKNYYLHAR